MAMTRGFRFNLATALGMMGVSTGWALATGFALPPLDFFALQWLATAVFGGIALIYVFVRPNPQAVRLMLNLIAGFWYSGFAILFSYLCATADRPLVDAGLAAA